MGIRHVLERTTALDAADPLNRRTLRRLLLERVGRDEAAVGKLKRRAGRQGPPFIVLATKGSLAPRDLRPSDVPIA